MNTLEIGQLSKSFGEHRVLQAVDLTLPAGTTTTVVGASGCGKTTLLRLVAGFERPDAGAIAIDGITVAASGDCLAAHRRSVGYVAQDGALFPHLSVGANIAYGLSRRLRGPAIRERVAELLDSVSLDRAFAQRRPHELSGGQQQRVALARALARSPSLMLLDEPFSALDSGLRVATRNAVMHVLSEAGITTLLVTHDQGEALSTADQVAVMRDGRFTSIGTPQQVYRYPADRFSAEFLGDCVLLACTVRAGTAASALGAVPVTAPDGPGMLMLRPEQLTASEIAAGAGEFMGTVLASEFFGHEVVLTISPTATIPPFTLRQSSLDPPEVGARIRIDIAGDAQVLR